jgi:uncharacterized membrane protein (GlpM family)
MGSSFFYKLGLSYVVGGAWIILTTVTAERHGSIIGGLIGGLPSTAVVALLFIGFTQTPLAASEATTIMPFAQGLNGLFIITYLLLIRRGLLFGISSALLTWLLLASVLAAIGIRSFWVSVAGWAALVSSCILVVTRWLEIPSRKKVPVRHTTQQIVLRALFGGAVIAFAVFMSKLAGPVFGGILATFPAMFLSTLVITHRTGGAEFSRAVAKVLMISGMINVALYAMAVRYLYTLLGLACGTALAFIFSCGTGYVTYLIMRARLSSFDKGHT